MPLTLATRILPDTLGKLEKAATRRYAEAALLVADEPLGAIYLFGYTVEMRLKAAYFRTIGLISTSPLDNPRKAAENKIRLFPGLKGPPGHWLYGWARLLEQTRATTHGVLPLPAGLVHSMYTHVQNIETCWTITLRYHANKPYNVELTTVQSSASWFRANGFRLWS
jgi:hypothetical protein